ncbi:MAG: hypothetical protein K0Q66_868 [Chitinophagaceae bacterium]|nr:hypothetical protein [Chitinophagaceae bacterium]
MKQSFLILLFITAAAHVLPAQYAFRVSVPTPVSEWLFNSPSPHSTRVHFDFELGKGNKLAIEMTQLGQLNHLPSVDSILFQVKRALGPLKDSFKADGIVRRIDYVATHGQPPKIRIVNHTERPKSYSYVEGELVQLKTDSDTVRIVLHVATGEMMRVRTQTGTKEWPGLHPFVMTLALNNIADINSLPDSTLSKAVNMILAQATKYLQPGAKKPNRNAYFYAHFDMLTGKMQPIKERYEHHTRNVFEPTIQMGLQYGRGDFIPSVGLGIQYIHGYEPSFGNSHLRLFWEPHFIFSRNTTNKLVTQRNDFITMQYTQMPSGKERRELYTIGNITLGYLALRRGDFFEKHTFKMGLPMLAYGNLLFEPQYFFDRGFRHFSPSVKFTMLFE